MTGYTNLEIEKEIELLNLVEGQYFDVKAKDIEPNKLSKTVSAFANASGGEIWIGIKEYTHTGEKELDGFEKIEDFNKFFQVLERLEGLNDNYSFIFYKFSDNTYCLCLSIEKTHAIVKSSNNDIYIRKGAQDLKVTEPDKIKRLELDKGIFLYENEIVAESDVEDAMGSDVYNDFAKKMIPNIDKYIWLRKQKLLKEGKLNVAGTLLFTDEPQVVLPKRSAIKIMRYKTSGEGNRDNLDGDPITIEGSAYSLIYDAVQKVKNIVESVKKLGDVFEDIIYPNTTLHEIITNAVLHRDYSIIEDIQERIFDNRVEVESPGKLAGHITLENILDEQFARNPKIVRLINKFPNAPNKDVGEGLNSAFKAMKELRLKQPIIEEKDASVLVIIKHEKLASPEETIIDYLKENKTITNKIGRQLTGIESENKMKNIFWNLRDAGLIEMVPELKGSKSAWKLVEENIENPFDNTQQLSLFNDDE